MYLDPSATLQKIRDSSKEIPNFTIPSHPSERGEPDEKTAKFLEQKEREKQDLIDSIVTEKEKSGQEAQKNKLNTLTQRELLIMLSRLIGPHSHISMNLMFLQQRINNLQDDEHWGNRDLSIPRVLTTDDLDKGKKPLTWNKIAKEKSKRGLLGEHL